MMSILSTAVIVSNWLREENSYKYLDYMFNWLQHDLNIQLYHMITH